MVLPVIDFWWRSVMDWFYERCSQCRTITWKACQTDAGNRLILKAKLKAKKQKAVWCLLLFIIYFHYLLVSESPNTHAEKDGCEPKQHSRLGQDIMQATAAQDKVQHTLHCPAGGKDLHSILYRRRE